MSYPLPARPQKDSTENLLNEGEGWIVPRYIPKESESSQLPQNADFESFELILNRATALGDVNSVPIASGFWAIHRSLETSKIAILEWMTTAARSCPSACVRRRHYTKLAEHVVRKGVRPPSEVKEAAINLEKCVEELQLYSRLNFNAEQISSCEAYFEK